MRSTDATMPFVSIPVQGTVLVPSPFVSSVKPKLLQTPFAGGCYPGDAVRKGARGATGSCAGSEVRDVGEGCKTSQSNVADSTVQCRRQQSSQIPAGCRNWPASQHQLLANDGQLQNALANSCLGACSRKVHSSLPYCRRRRKESEQLIRSTAGALAAVVRPLPLRY